MTDRMGIEPRAARLKIARRARFPSAAQAAEVVGMKPVTVRSHENGQNGFPVSTAKAYADAYGVSLDWLLTGDGVGPSAIRGAPERLAAAREASGYSSATAAANANGWTVSTYLGHENGSRGLTPDVAEVYAAAFGVTPQSLLYGDDEAPRAVVSDQAQWLRDRLAETGRSQTELARALGLDASAVNRMCSGLRDIKAREMVAIDAFFSEGGLRDGAATSSSMRPLPAAPLTVTSDGRGGARLQIDMTVPMATALKVLGLLEGAE